MRELQVLFFAVLPFSVVYNQCVVTNITDFATNTITDATIPMIDGDIIAFRGFEGSLDNTGIYIYKNDTISLVPGNDRAFRYGFQDGDVAYIVSQTNSVYEVYLYANGLLSTITPITPSMTTLDDISIYNQTVTWSADNIVGNIAPTSNIFKYENGQTTQLTFETVPDQSQSKPRVSDAYIVWEGGTGVIEESSQIFAYDRQSDQIRVVSQEFANSTVLNGNVDVSGEIITWSSLNNSEWWIHRYTGDTSEVLDKFAVLTGSPSIDGEEIVWSRFTNNRSEVYHYIGGNINLLSEDVIGFNHGLPKISEGRVAWLSGDENGLLLYYWAGDEAGPIELTALVPNSDMGTIPNSNLFDISRNQVVWMAQKDGVNQIYRAVCESECPIDLRLSGVVDSPGDIIPHSARDEITSSQTVLNGGLRLNAPEVQLELDFLINSDASLEILNEGCNTEE